MSFEINEDLLTALDEYHERSMLLEKHKIEKNHFVGNLQEAVNDDLMWHVPIYDMGSRKYASFCSLTEALWKKENDVKKNGIHFKHHEIKEEIDWLLLFYLFRLCGSGINYKPKVDHFYGSHGFGNFWIVDSILSNKFDFESWLCDLEIVEKPFTDNKGYLLPQFSFKELDSGHLKKFILEYSVNLVLQIYEKLLKNRLEIYQVTDFGNNILKNWGFKKQNFVLTAFAADVAEYFPNLVDPKSKVYAGTNADKCINAIFPKKKGLKVKDFDYINDVLGFLSNRYNLNPIDCEDSRACDLVRYFKEYQSDDHIAKNGKAYKNNSILKNIWGSEKYYYFVNNLK
jgi:hypothetical protein